MIKPALCALIVLANFCATGTAAASVSGMITTIPVTITLTDLDLNDGIVPSLSFTPTVPVPDDTRVARASVGFYDLDGQELEVHSMLADGANPMFVSRTFGGNMTGEAGITGRGAFETHALSASSSASGPGAWGASSASADSGWFDFVLSPNTRVSIEMTAHVSGTAITSPDSYSYIFYGAHLGMWVGPERDYYGQSQLFDLHTHNLVSSLDADHVFTATYDNRSTDPATGFVELSLFTHAKYEPLPVSSIPEPGTVPTMTLGLGVIGLWARRRRAQRALPR